MDGHEVYTGDLATISEADKDKFPQEYFPNCKWSRKGYLRTRWRIRGTEVDLVNIHLFHDACNMIAIEAVRTGEGMQGDRARHGSMEKGEMEGMYDNRV